MVALPNKENFTGSNVSQGSFKEALDDLRDFLAGLLGSDGTAAAARTALGLSNAATTSIASINYALIPQGTRMMFAQASTPVGWTQDASVNDRVLRVVSGSGGGLGGSWTISGLTVAGHTLTISQIPAHSHSGSTSSAGSHTHTIETWSHASEYPGSDGLDELPNHEGRANTSPIYRKLYDYGILPAGAHTHSLSLNNTGGGGSHSHGISHDGNWRPSYLDTIVATKD